jgi:hypothetical protein
MPQTEKLDRLLGAEPLAIGGLILMEVLQGFDTDREFQEAHRLLTSLKVVELGGLATAIQVAKNFRTLRGRGALFADDRHSDRDPVYRGRVRVVA